MFLVFFFKQKTAYEMRISDWSSDVCSSDLYEKIPLLASANLWGDYQLRAVEGFREARQDHFASLVSIFNIVVTGSFRDAPLVRELMSASDKRSVRAHYRESLLLDVITVNTSQEAIEQIGIASCRERGSRDG